MLKYLVPRFPLADLPIMLVYAAAGSLIAGTYGVIHDQITFAIGPEYFTKFKFHQFGWANIGLGQRGFVACIGFLATWWLGMVVAWILARRLLPNHSRPVARKKILQGFLIVFLVGFVAGVSGYGYGNWRGPDADYSQWQPELDRIDVTDTWRFMRVAYIHNAGYLGGLIGLILTFFLIRIEKSPKNKIEIL